MLHVILKITFKYLTVQVGLNPIVFWRGSFLKATSLALTLRCTLVLIFFFRWNFRSAWIKLCICIMLIWPEKFWRANSLIMIGNHSSLYILLSKCLRIGLSCHINVFLPSVTFKEVIACLIIELSSLRLESSLWDLNWMRAFWGRRGEFSCMHTPCFSLWYNSSFPSIGRDGTIFREYMQVIPTYSYHLHFNQWFLYFSMHLLYRGLFVQIIRLILYRLI